MKLYANRLGSGAPVIILHGLLGSSDNWFTLGKIMAGSYNVHLLDQRNHGRSPHSPEFSYEAMAQDLHHYLDDNSLEPVLLIGHSMGGKTAMTFAARYPQRVRHLVVVDVAPKRYESTFFRQLFRVLQEVDPAGFSTRQEIDAALVSGIPEVGLRAFILKNLHRNNGGGYSWKMNLPVIARSLDAISAALPPSTTFAGPVRFISGAKSAYILPEDLPRLRVSFPQADLRMVENAGHWVHAENPSGFMQALADIMPLS